MYNYLDDVKINKITQELTDYMNLYNYLYDSYTIKTLTESNKYLNIDCTNITYYKLFKLTIKSINSLNDIELIIYEKVIMENKNSLQLSSMDLTEIPNNLPDYVEIIWLNNNKITEIHKEQLPKGLTKIHLNNNQITVLPDLSHLKDLRITHLEHNPLTSYNYYNLPKKCHLYLSSKKF
jgi:hypothetical protein